MKINDRPIDNKKPIAASNVQLQNEKLRQFVKDIQILAHLKVDGKPIVSPEDQISEGSRARAIMSWAKAEGIDPKLLPTIARLIKNDLQAGKLEEVLG